MSRCLFFQSALLHQMRSPPGQTYSSKSQGLAYQPWSAHTRQNYSNLEPTFATFATINSNGLAKVVSFLFGIHHLELPSFMISSTQKTVVLRLNSSTSVAVLSGVCFQNPVHVRYISTLRHVPIPSARALLVSRSLGLCGPL